jgi:hypothetical protein
MRLPAPLVRAVVFSVLVAVPAGAVAAQVAREAVAAPKAGTWKTVKDGYGYADVAGTFTVTKSGYVTKLRGTMTSDAETACGTGTVAVPKAQKMFDAKGMDSEGGSYNEWVVGINDPSADPVIQPKKVTVTVDGKSVAGKLDIVFPHGAGDGAGDIEYDHGNCDLQFDIAH